MKHMHAEHLAEVQAECAIIYRPTQGMHSQGELGDSHACVREKKKKAFSGCPCTSCKHFLFQEEKTTSHTDVSN